jgi:ABC-type sugar transport system permease subunit
MSDVVTSPPSGATASTAAVSRVGRDVAPASTTGRQSHLPPGSDLPEKGLDPGGPTRRKRDTAFSKLSQWGGLYLLLLPTVLSMVVFSYYPKADVFIKSVYDWTPGRTQEWVGLQNFQDLFGDRLFWSAFQVVAIMLVANLFKMWPSIFTAVAMHRIASDKWRYIYQVTFVIPMIIPGMVTLLIWKSFYDPELGLLNRILNATGGMTLLTWLDGVEGAPGVMPKVAATLQPLVDFVVRPLFGTVWGLLFFGAALLASTAGTAARDDEEYKPAATASFGQRAAAYLKFPPVAKRLAGAGLLVLGTVLFPACFAMLASGPIGFFLGLGLLAAWCVAATRLLGVKWVLWGFLLLFGYWAVSGEVWRLPMLLVAAVVIAEVLRGVFHPVEAHDWTFRTGLTAVLVGGALVGLTMIWTEPTGQFATGAPAWLGSETLALPSLILWGFPWVGTFGVLIYLAGLQQIGQDVYEAAEIDGLGAIGKLFKLELPLILTQVRINLIFMTIGTLTAYEFFLILLGPDGGPGNVAMVPGLYMYNQAFINLKYGYACALGVTLFCLILGLTIIYQKYVKVDK